MAHGCSRSVKALPACALPPPSGAPRSQVEKLQLLAGTVRPNTRRKGAGAASALIPPSPSGRPTGSSLSRGKKELPPPPHSQRAPKPSPAHSGIRDSGPPGTAHRSPLLPRSIPHPSFTGPWGPRPRPGHFIGSSRGTCSFCTSFGGCVRRPSWSMKTWDRGS